MFQNFPGDCEVQSRLRNTELEGHKNCHICSSAMSEIHRSDYGVSWWRGQMGVTVKWGGPDLTASPWWSWLWKRCTSLDGLGICFWALHNLLLLLSRFSRVQLCATPQTAAHQAPPSLGFSRQEHWSGLPVPSPMHESGKWKWSRSVVSDPSRPHGLQPTRLLSPWDFPGKSTGVGCHCLLHIVYWVLFYFLYFNSPNKHKRQTQPCPII